MWCHRGCMRTTARIGTTESTIERALGIRRVSRTQVAVSVCVPDVCRIKEARYRDTVSAQLTADQSSASQTTDNSICC